MEILKISIQILILLIAVDWLIQFILSILTAIRVPGISSVNSRGDNWPALSVIVPAANEESTIKKATVSKLETDYPNVEFILVNDRSEDRTGQIMDEIAAKDNRIKVIHINNLPEGWLGKLNAMNEGLKISNGEWVLFSDADVHYKKETLKKALYFARHNSLDHLVVAPKLHGGGFFVKCIFAVFARLISILFKIWASNSKDSKAGGGAGAFNLVRKETLLNSKGFEWIKMEVADDAALGMMLKEAGAKNAALIGKDYVHLNYYNSVMEMARGIERASYTTMGRFSFIRLIFMAFLLVAELFPFAVFIFAVHPFVLYSGIAAITMSVFTSLLFSRGFAIPVYYSLFWPVGSVLCVFMTVRAAFVGRKTKGITWRGTFYSEKELRRGQRYKP